MQQRNYRRARNVLVAAAAIVLLLGMTERQASAQDPSVACADAVLTGVNAADVCGDSDLVILLEDELTSFDPARPLVNGSVTIRDPFGVPLLKLDVDGTTTLSGIAPGFYRVEANAPRHQASVILVELRAGETTTEVFFLGLTLLTTRVEEALSGTVPDKYNVELATRNSDGLPLYTWEQDVTVTRPWFAYEVSIDAAGLASPPTGLSVVWRVDGEAQNYANRYDVTPELTGLTTETDGTWSMVSSAATLAAQFTATSALDIDEATPVRVSGTLMFEVDGSTHMIELPPRPVILEPVADVVVEHRIDSNVSANEAFINAVLITNEGSGATPVTLQPAPPQAAFPISITSPLIAEQFTVAPGDSAIASWDFVSASGFTGWEQTVTVTRESENFSDSVVRASLPAGSNGCTVRWTSASDGDWGDALNWITPSGLVRAPTVGDDVCVLADVGEVTVTTGTLESIDIASLVNEQTIVLRRDLTASTVNNRGTMQWVRRRSELIGHVINEPEGVLTVDGGEVLDFGGDSTIENFGLIDVQSGEAFGFRIGGSNSTSSSLTNLAGGTVRLAGGTSVTGRVFINRPGALIETSGIGTARLHFTLEGFQEQGGTIRTAADAPLFMRSCGTCTRSFTNTLFDIATGSEFRTESAIGGEHQVTGTLQPAPGATGAGSIHFSDTFYANGLVIVDFPEGGQRFIFDGTNPHTVGIMGSVRIAPDSVAHLEGAGASGMNILQGGRIANRGTFRILENGGLYGEGEFVNTGRFEVDLVPAIADDERAEIGRGGDLTFVDAFGVIAATRGNVRFDASARFTNTTFEAAATQEIQSNNTQLDQLISGTGQGTVRFNRDLSGRAGTIVDFPATGPDLILDGSNPNTVRLTGSLIAAPSTVTSLRGAGASGMIIEAGATFINEGTFRLLENSDLYGDGTFVNTGTFETAFDGVSVTAIADIGRGGDLRFEDDGGVLRMENGAIDFEAQLLLDGTSIVVPTGATMTSQHATTFAGTVTSTTGGGVFEVADVVVGDRGVVDFSAGATELIFTSGTEQSGNLTNAGVLTIIGLYDLITNGELANQGELKLSGAVVGGAGALRNHASGTLRATEGNVRLGVDETTVIDELGGLVSAADVDLVIEGSAQTSLTSTRFEAGAGRSITVESDTADMFAGTFGPTGSAAGGQVVFAHSGATMADPLVSFDFPGSGVPNDASTDITMRATSGSSLSGVWQVNSGTTLICDGGCAPESGATLRILGTLQLDRELELQGGTLELVETAAVVSETAAGLRIEDGALVKTGAGTASIGVMPLNALLAATSAVSVNEGTLLLQPVAGAVPVDGTWLVRSTATVQIDGDAVVAPSLGYSVEVDDAAHGHTVVQGQATLPAGTGPTISVLEAGAGSTAETYEILIAASGFNGDTTLVDGTLPVNHELVLELAGAAGTGPSIDVVNSGPTGECDDGIAWTTDSFDGVECVSVPNEGAPCDDGSLATLSDVVTNGVCVGTPFNCDDGVAWTTDIVDDEVGCRHEFDVGADCDDLDPTTEADVVTEAGACVGTSVECDDGIAWTTDSFDGVECVSVPNEGAPCDDGDAATQSDVVITGECVGGLIDCDDGVGWTTDTFDGTECVSAAEEGAACDDGSLATTNDVVANGECTGAPVDCTDGPNNSIGTVDPDLGCVYDIDIGAPCDDGSANTRNDAVSGSGECVGTPLACSHNGVVVFGICSCDVASNGFWSGDDCSTFVPNPPAPPPAKPVSFPSAFFPPPPPDPVAVVYTAVCVSDTQVLVRIEEIDTETLGNVVAVVTNGSPATNVFVAPGAPIVVTLLLSEDTQVTIDGPDVAPLCPAT